ncbi:hypothetical protein [Streptomyces wuyuanensis]|uniref:hypothetical protein n=1 Tax=Streptomyces wuyuanensis TaxID=1196353 RepID=UPI003D712C45
MTTDPAHCTRVSWCAPHCSARQWQDAFGRTVAARAWAAACLAANARKLARSLERGGIRHAEVLHETVAE